MVTGNGCKPEKGSIFFVLDCTVASFYAIELSVQLQFRKAVVQKPLFKGIDGIWNVFDIFLICADIISLVLQAVAAENLSTPATGHLGGQIVRVLRVCHVAQGIMFLEPSTFHELRLTTLSIYGSPGKVIISLFQCISCGIG